MDNSKLLLAIVVIAVLALVGRLIINKQQKNGSINVAKLLALFGGVVVFVITFSLFNPHRFWQWYEGEASMEDGRSGCIAGRKAGKDITRFAGPSDDNGGLYYALQVSELTPTGFFRTKNPIGFDDTQRTVEQNDNEKEVIRHTRNMFDITRNPGDKAEKYMPIYLATLVNKDHALVAIEEEDAVVGELPIAMMRPTNEKLASIASATEDTFTEFYFVAFDEARYARNATANYIYKGAAGLLGAIAVALAYLIWKRKK